MAQAIAIEYDRTDGPLVRKAAETVERTLRERASVPMDSAADHSVSLRVLGHGPAEGYAIRDGRNRTVLIEGNDGRGLIFGVGRFLRECRFDFGDVTLCPWRGSSTPAKPVRAIYFATHFHNWYHEAPLELVQRYVEELALWGCNCIGVWFDMHHFSGIDDPDAVKMIERLRGMMRAAADVGIGVALLQLANEAYASSDPALRADWTAGHDGYTKPPGGHYHVELCPSKPGALEQILAYRREMLDAFTDMPIERAVIWPYDQGGCTCSHCAPWGANGFLRTAEPVAAAIKDHFPNTDIILSTWYFNKFVAGEWEGLCNAFDGGAPDWIDVLLVDNFGGFPELPFSHGVPGDLPMVGFPEISMEGNGPWGGYGALPRPRHWQAYWDRTKAVLHGSFPYSEGIYEDLSKVMILQWEWAPDRAADDIVREYAAAWFGHDVARQVVTLARSIEQDEGLAVGSGDGVYPAIAHRGLEHAEECFALAQRIDAGLPPHIALSWRWRVFWLRAAIGAQLAHNGGISNAATDRCFEELIRIYAAERAERPVAPPSRRALARVTR